MAARRWTDPFYVRLVDYLRYALRRVQCQWAGRTAVHGFPGRVLSQLVAASDRVLLESAFANL